MTISRVAYSDWSLDQHLPTSSSHESPETKYSDIETSFRLDNQLSTGCLQLDRNFMALLFAKLFRATEAKCERYIANRNWGEELLNLTYNGDKT